MGWSAGQNTGKVVLAFDQYGEIFWQLVIDDEFRSEEEFLSEAVILLQYTHPVDKFRSGGAFADIGYLLNAEEVVDPSFDVVVIAFADVESSDNDVE